MALCTYTAEKDGNSILRNGMGWEMWVEEQEEMPHSAAEGLGKRFAAVAMSMALLSLSGANHNGTNGDGSLASAWEH